MHGRDAPERVEQLRADSLVDISFRSASGEVSKVEAKVGESLMRAAKDNDIDGVIAECGGNQVCGTCLVYVDEPWFSRLRPPDELEAEMIEYAMHPQPTARLSCQILVSSELHGMSVETPVSQR